jgi:small-conductance mechanosensitive channel
MVLAAGWIGQNKLLRWLEPLATFAVALVAVFFLRQLVLGWLRRRAKTPQSPAAAVLDTVSLPSILWCLAAAVAISLRWVDLTKQQVRWADKSMVVFLIVSLSLVAASVAVRMITAYGEGQQMPFAAAGLSKTLARILVLAIGAMSLLAYLDVTIAPLLTALGVGALAVALALQDTLANFFAGIHILVERPILVGDLIRLENGEEGTVTDIGWRTTRVRTGANNMVVVPNTTITSGILVNYQLPDPRTAAEIAIAVAQEADPELVRRIALEEAAQVEGVLADPAPLVLCDPGLLPTHLQLKLLVSVAERRQQFRIQSEIRLRLLRRFRAEGIPLARVWERPE